MHTLRSTKPFLGPPMAKIGNYDDYQSYVEDQTQYNKDVRVFYLKDYKLCSI